MSGGLSWGLRKRLYEQASAQLENGRTITEILQDFRDRLARRGRKKAAEAAHHVLGRVMDGDTLMKALSSNLPELERGVLASGEQTGQIARAMRLILDVRDRTTRMRRKLQSSFFAPVAYLLSLYAVLFVIGVYIVPQFLDTVPLPKWTGWAYALYCLGQVAVGWFAPLVAIGFGCLIGVIWWALPRWTGADTVPGRTFCDLYMPGFSEYREITGFTWLISFAALLRAGVPDTDALATQIGAASPWLESRLRPIQAGLRNGLKLDAAMRRTGHGFPSIDLIDEVGAYVGFPDFPDMIEKVARQYAETLERRLVLKGVLVSAIFSALMFMAFIVVQLGANSISTILQSSVGTF